MGCGCRRHAWKDHNDIVDFDRTDAAGYDPTVINGDIIGGTNARLGGGEWMVVEADESVPSSNYRRLSRS